MANHRRTEASARLKKFYSMLQNASTRAKADGKSWSYWAETGTIGDNTLETVQDFSNYYLFPYISYSKYEINGNVIYVYLNDGTYFYTYKGDCIDFRVDINGKKKPNVLGRDIFCFLYCADSVKHYLGGGGKIIPYIEDSEGKSREKALNRCKSSPARCAGLLMIDGWEFKDDYPYSI